MIIKSYEINKINFDQHKLILLYGKNEGLKNEVIINLLKTKIQILRYLSSLINHLIIRNEFYLK